MLYASIHQWPLYPGTGAAAYAGEAEGEGYTLNLPVPPGAGSDEFLVAGPARRRAPPARFEPGLVAISAGYDAHRDDPLAQCPVERAAYADMAATMRDLAAELEAPVLVCLEGGYDPGALAASVLATARALGKGVGRRRVAPAGPAEPHLSRLRERWDL